jgi:small nuclear ribonucleoprotein (snRNP)-like protein
MRKKMKNKFEELIGKKIFIKLKSGSFYNGIVKDTTESFIFIIDKFGEKVIVNITDISSVEEKE